MEEIDILGPKKRFRFRRVLEGEAYDLSTVLEDFRNQEIPPTGSILRKFRQRLYGVMLHEKPGAAGGPILVPEWCMTGLGSLNLIQKVEVIAAPDFHPGLKSLWAQDDQSLDDIRFNLDPTFFFGILLP